MDIINVEMKRRLNEHKKIHRQKMSFTLSEINTIEWEDGECLMEIDYGESEFGLGRILLPPEVSLWFHSEGFSTRVTRYM